MNKWDKKLFAAIRTISNHFEYHQATYERLLLAIIGEEWKGSQEVYYDVFGKKIDVAQMKVENGNLFDLITVGIRVKMEDPSIYPTVIPTSEKDIWDVPLLIQEVPINPNGIQLGTMQYHNVLFKKIPIK